MVEPSDSGSERALFDDEYEDAPLQPGSEKRLSIRRIQAKLLFLLEVHCRNSALIWYIQTVRVEDDAKYAHFTFKKALLEMMHAFRYHPNTADYHTEKSEFNMHCGDRALLENYTTLIEKLVLYFNTPEVAKVSAPSTLSAPPRWRQCDRVKTYTKLIAHMAMLAKKPAGEVAIQALRDDMAEKYHNFVSDAERERQGLAYRTKVWDFIDKLGYVENFNPTSWLMKDTGMFYLCKFDVREIAEAYVAEVAAILAAHEV